MRSCREPIGADLNHSTISSLLMFRLLGPLSALGSLHTANRFLGLAIGVRGKDRGSRITLQSCDAHMNPTLPTILALLLGVLMLWLALVAKPHRIAPAASAPSTLDYA